MTASKRPRSSCLEKSQLFSSAKEMAIHIFKKLQTHTSLQASIVAVGALLILSASLYVNLGLFRASLDLEPKLIEATGDPATYRYPLTGNSLLEKKSMLSLPGGWAKFYDGNSRLFVKSATREALIEKPGNRFFVTQEALYFTVSDDADPRLNDSRYRFERPLQPKWSFTAWAVFVLLTAAAVYRFQAKGIDRWVLIHDVILIALFSSLLWSTLKAPGGSFINSYGGSVDMWQDDDPGGWYIASAHELGRKPVVFAGHPAIPLQIGLSLIQRTVSIFADSAFTYSEAVAANIFYVQVLSRAMCMLAFIAASLVLRKVATLLFNNRFIGMMASLLFSTSFFSVYIMTRVSTEGFTMLFFLLTFLFVILACKHIDKSNLVLMYSFLACFASMFAFYSKIQLMGPLPFFAFACFVLFYFQTSSWRHYLTMMSFCLLGFVSSWLFLEPYMDWPSFHIMWMPHGLSMDANIPAWRNYYRTTLAVAKLIFDSIGNISVENTLPIADHKRISFAFGSATGLLFIVSFFWASIRKNKVFVAMGIYSALTVGIFLYRSKGLDFHGFHYLFPFLAVASISSAFVIHQITEKNADGLPNNHGLFALLIVLLLNINGFQIAINSHKHRAQSNADALQIYEALSRLSPRETIMSSVNIPAAVGINTRNTYNLGEPSKLEDALRRLAISPFSYIKK